jgi:hypothetical protein
MSKKGLAMKGALGEKLKKQVGDKKSAITAAQKELLLQKVRDALEASTMTNDPSLFALERLAKRKAGSLERLRNLTAELIELERGGDADAAQFVEQDFEVVTQPKVRTVYRSSAGRRPSHVVSELVGWEEVVVPVGAPIDQAVGLERERALGSASATVSGSAAQSDKGSSSFEQSSESTKIISLGAPPAGDVMEWAQSAYAENMPINYQLASICQLVKLALERDFPGVADLDRGEHVEPKADDVPEFMNIKLTNQLKQEVINACNWAAYDDHYCMFLKAEGKFMTMTCDTPPGGIERKPKVPECLNDMQCEGKRSPLHSKCVSGVCVMKYKRLVDVGVMTTQDVNSNQCSNMKGHGWTEVKIDTTDSLGNNIKGKTSDSKIRLCAKYSEDPVDEKDAATHGVCKMMLSATDPCAERDGYNFVEPILGGMSDGDMNQWEHDPPLWLCVAKDGCEGRGNDDISNPIPALENIGLARNDDGKCPKELRSGHRIATFNGANGDFNQNMGSGGDVWMCEQPAKPTGLGL